MPYKLAQLKNGEYSVTGPSGKHAKKTSLKKAKAQIRLLQGVEHSKWRPTGKKSKT